MNTLQTAIFPFGLPPCFIYCYTVFSLLLTSNYSILNEIWLNWCIENYNENIDTVELILNQNLWFNSHIRSDKKPLHFKLWEEQPPAFPQPHRPSPEGHGHRLSHVPRQEQRWHPEQGSAVATWQFKCVTASRSDVAKSSPATAATCPDATVDALDPAIAVDGRSQ